ncbi:MAG TPA: hypothetical protein VHC97_22705 [Thermoanaerobaculia bacterium]|jgi:hypothetical protein|nr:hypothetical protein [Thermoanaerobaculia bacterium]
MSRNIFRRLVAVFVLFVVLGTPLASWAGPAAQRSETRLAGPAPLAWFWSFLARVWTKAGCRIDPNGQCLPEPVMTPKEGCRIDPDGRCVTNPVTVTDEGCLIDPNGGCLDRQ